MNQSLTNPSSLKVAFIQARWHADIVDEARKSYIEELAKLTDNGIAVEVFDVPGVFEAPLLARTLAGTGKYAAVVAAGFVVDGGIYRHDFVSDAVIKGLMQAQMDTDVPVLSVVLTPHHYHDSKEHHDFFHAHFVVKGREAAHATVQILNTYSKIEA